MADANVFALQSTINRYARAANFSAIGVDGIMGTQTAQALIKALAWVQANVDGEADTATSLVVDLVNSDGTYNFTQMSSSASGLNTYLSQNADTAGLPAVMVATSGSGGGTKLLPTTTMPSAGVATDLLTSFQNLPTWAKVVGGLVLGFVAYTAYETKTKKPHKTNRRRYV
jgi:hypothetical protein